MEKLIYLAVGVKPERLSRYCRPNEEELVGKLVAMRNPTMESINRAWFHGT
jgi:hypothetical protein